MIGQILKQLKSVVPDPVSSNLFDEDTFYRKFLNDLGKCQREVIIESPFITSKRTLMLLPTLKKLKEQRVRIVINTRAPSEHDDYLRHEAEQALITLQRIGIQVIYTNRHHRKIAVLDRNVLWEGSLNILSQNNSREIMRRTDSTALAWQMVRFTKLDGLMN